MSRGDLSNGNWLKIEPLLPPEHSGKKGRPYVGHRQVLNGILWRMRTGASWRDIPSRYGPHQTCYDRFVRWLRSGLWLKLLQTLQAQADVAGQLDWSQSSVDGSVIRAHQHAAGATLSSSQALLEQSQQQAEAKREPNWGSLSPKQQIQAVQALGYSAGGFSTKIHLVCEAKGRPLAASLSPGQAHDSQHLAAVLDQVRVPRPARGRPRKRPY